MPKIVAECVLSLALALAAPAAYARDPAPDALLRAVSADVIEQLQHGLERQVADPAKIKALVETRILPLFDFVQMTQFAVARNWRLATPEQQSAITEEFKTRLVRTYATALARYRGERIEYRQLRATPLGTEATVRAEVKRPGNERTTLDYEMERTPAGWKIYNVKVADVSLLSNYRDVFAEKVRHGGVDGLINFLADENRGGDSRFNSIKTSFWEKSRVMYAIFQNLFRSAMH